MAFKKVPPPQVVPDSPEKILLDFPRRKIPGVLLHQGELMRTYASTAVNEPDVALQLPTGSGKTLVGLMVGEWRRRKFGERVVYLCPTRQLVNQVAEQSEEQYGLSVNAFTGSISGYDTSAKAQYQNADRLAITTYSSLFNVNPFFDKPELIVVDDAHAAENYIAAMWTLRIEREKKEHATLHGAVSGVLKPLMNATNFTRLTGAWESIADLAWVDKIPTPRLAEICDELIAVIDTHVGDLDIRFPWSMIRDNLHACHLYMTTQDIFIRPLIPPTWTHQPFANAKQRIFMSATLGAGGDLERLSGRRKVLRLPVPQGWDRQGIGRRYFIFPEMSLNDAETQGLRRELMREAGRSLVLVPSERARKQIVEDIIGKLGFRVFGAEEIESSKKPFVQTAKAVAIVANRYDGIDFPGDDCRLLFIDGLPRATNSQERFLMSRMGANVLFNERIQTRVLQAIGRCTRSLQDYSAVVVTGEELPDYLTDRNRRSHFHPELQAEIEFGIEQSTETNRGELVDNFRIFLANDKEWEEANELILAKRAAASLIEFPAMDQLKEVAAHEIEFQERLWQSDFEAALEAAERVLATLTEPGLRGYRALWHYLAGCTAWYGGKAGIDALVTKARLQFAEAKEAARGIPWLVELARVQGVFETIPPVDDRVQVFIQIERLEAILARLGTIHDRQYEKLEKEILDGLDSKNKTIFEPAHKRLGELLGFDAGKIESDGSPDPWWASGKYCFVFEDHAGAGDTSTIDVKKARQAASHPNWLKANVGFDPDTEFLAVLVTPATKAKEGAIPHLGEVSLWTLDDFRKWARKALATIRSLRRLFVEPGDLVWRAQAAEEFERNTMDAPSLFKKLGSHLASEHLNQVK